MTGRRGGGRVDVERARPRVKRPRGGRSRAARAAAGLAVLAGVLAFAFVAFSWFEAEKEVRILCAMMPPGTAVERARATLDTGHRLRYVATDGGLTVTSPWTLGATRCDVVVAGGRVTASRYTDAVRLERLAAWPAAAGLGALAVFQLLLAAGAPLGRAAWGGRQERLDPERLPAALRVGSFVSAGLALAGAGAVLEKAGLVELFGGAAAAAVVWALVPILAGSAVLNRVAGSPVERRVMAPAAAVLAALCLLVALKG